MKDGKKTKAELAKELERLRLEVRELEAADAARQKAEEALRASEERYRSLQANVPVGIFRSTADPGGRILSANAALAHMFGYADPGDMTRTLVAELYANPGDREKSVASVSSAGVVSGYEVRFKKADGSVFWGAVSARAVRGAYGEIVHIDGTVEDITERKRIEEERNDHRQLASLAARDLGAIFDNVDVLLWSVKTDADGYLRYEKVNDAFAAVEGRTPDYYAGKRIVDIATPEQLDAITKRFESVKTGKPCVYGKEVGEGPGRKEFIIRLIPLVDDDGQVRRFIGSATDVTGPKRTEGELKRHVRILEGMNEITRAINRAADVAELLDSAAAFLADNPGVLGGAVYLVDAETGCLRLARSFGRELEVYGGRETMSLDETNVKLILESPVAVFVDDWARESAAPDAPAGVDGGRGQVVAAALRSEDAMLGALTMVLEGADIQTMAFVEMMGSELGAAISRKRSEEALRENEETARVLLNAPANVAFLIDTEGTILNFNETARARTRLAEGELRGRSLWDVLPAAVVERRKSSVRKAARTGRPTYFEETRPAVAYENLYYPVLADDGRVAKVAVFSWRTAERKESERALGATLQEFLAAADASAEACFRADAQGRIFYANAAASEIFGLSQDELREALSVAELVNGNEESSAAALREVLEGEEEVTAYVTARKSDGRAFPAYIRSAVVGAGENKELRFLFADTSERGRIAEMLKAGREPAEVLETSRSPSAFATDAEGGIEACNAPTLARLGVAAESVLGRPFYDYLPPPLADSRKRRFEEAVRRRAPLYFEDEYPGAIYENDIYPIMDSRGEVARLAYFSRDVTVQKRTEEELVRYRHHLEVLVDERTDELRIANVKLQREIAERKRAEEEIRYISEFTANIIESTQVGIYALDKDGMVQIWNRGMEEQFGVDSEELIGRTIFEAFPVLRREPLGIALERALKHGERYEQSGLVHETLKKGRRVLNTKINPLSDEAGVIVGAVVITEDVTERVRAVEQTRKSEKLYRGLYNTTLALADETELDAVLRQIADQAMALLDGDDCTVYLLHRERGVLEPIFANTVKDYEAVMAFYVPLGRGLTGTVAETGVGRYVNIGDEDGFSTHIPGTDLEEDSDQSVVAVPMFDAGAVLGVLTICKSGGVFDDDELEKLSVFARQAEMAIKRARSLEALRDSEERYRGLIETIHDGFAIVDGNENILFVNQAYCDIMGYAKEELTRMNIKQLIPEGEVRRVLEATDVKKKERTSTKYEVVMRRKDGQLRDVLVSSTPLLDEKGEYRLTIGVALDITDQKRTEAELQLKTEQLEEAHRRADELLRNILPEQVIKELAVTNTSVPRLVPNVTIVFVDVVDFSNISARLNHKALLTKLSAYFHAFDLIVKDLNLEKLKTVGDGYMYAGGLFAEDNQLAACAEAALSILEFVKKGGWEVRIGVHVGPCIAGLVKGWRMIYDVWGETVNVASRLHEAGEPGRINVSEAVRNEAAEEFEFEYRGTKPLHTIGPMPMYFLTGRKKK
jgi:PAS domain S-box-containing protein